MDTHVDRYAGQKKYYMKNKAKIIEYVSNYQKAVRSGERTKISAIPNVDRDGNLIKRGKPLLILNPKLDYFHRNRTAVLAKQREAYHRKKKLKLQTPEDQTHSEV